MVSRPSESLAASAPENYERFIVPVICLPLAKHLIKNAALEPGERVLDAACGTGIVARLAAQRVGTDGSVAALDVNPGMLGEARLAAPMDAPIEWYQACVESMPFPDRTFDVVLCQLSLQFVQDKLRALTEMHRVLGPGGRVLVNVPGPTPDLFDILAQSLERHVGSRAGRFVRDVFSLNDKAELEGLLTKAGFEDVAIESYHKALVLPSARSFLWQYVNGTPLSAILVGVDDEARSRLERDVVAHWRVFEIDGGAMRYTQRVLLASARR
jgi:ubiquinone/menaquinone biosynthesis C-methylase UbiE